MKTSKPKTIIIELVPLFLEYCRKEKHFLPRSIENYNYFLNRLITWLKKSKLENLVPQEFSIDHLRQYKDYLSRQISPESKRPILRKTQNFYLIALRALFSYFAEKDISSFNPARITLLKEYKSNLQQKNLLDLVDSSEKLLDQPNTSNIQEDLGIRRF